MEKDTDLVKAVAEGGAVGFLKTIAPAWVEGGEWGADLIRRHRFKTQVKTLIRAKEICEEAGIDPGAISYKVLVPLLENVSLEDDPEESADPAGAAGMHERWAALLANAAAGEAGAHVHPGFATILAELTPTEAAMLDWLADREWRASVTIFSGWQACNPKTGAAQAPADTARKR